MGGSAKVRELKCQLSEHSSILACSVCSAVLPFWLKAASQPTGTPLLPIILSGHFVWPQAQAKHRPCGRRVLGWPWGSQRRKRGGQKTLTGGALDASQHCSRLARGMRWGMGMGGKRRRWAELGLAALTSLSKTPPHFSQADLISPVLLKSSSKHPPDRSSRRNKTSAVICLWAPLWTTFPLPHCSDQAAAKLPSLPRSSA